jgi:methylglutamate dehydrogenase subunit D
VADLAPRSAHAPDLPLTVGQTTLDALPDTPMLSLAPFHGRDAETAAALGAALPPPGATAPLPDGMILWAGIGLWFLRGPGATRLTPARPAAVTDQSDAWSGFALTGPDATDTLARLVPLDLDPAAFRPGAVARTPLRHIPCLLLRTDAGFELLVPRSLTRTAAHDLAEAMRAVAARAALKS